jgi:hypothetical protein
MSLCRLLYYYFNAECHYTECRNAECRIIILMLSVIKPNVTMQSVVYLLLC